MTFSSFRGQTKVQSGPEPRGKGGVARKRFCQAVTSRGEDVLRRFARAFEAESAKRCVIGGLAVNAYAEPVVSLDLDAVVVVLDFAALLGRHGPYATSEQTPQGPRGHPPVARGAIPPSPR